jgi:vacuolar protein sorting-associated protein 45
MDITKLRSIRVIDTLLKHAGSAKRGGDLFGNKTLLSSVGQWMKSGLKGVENIYTQHKPLLAETLAMLTQNKLKTTSYPYTDSASAAAGAKSKYRLILLYVIGGITYEEVLAVENFNNANAGVRVVIGGNCIHNSASFIEDLLTGAPAEDAHAIDIDV